MKNIQEWLGVVIAFILLILPGLLVLWKVIIFNIFPDTIVTSTCMLMFALGCLSIYILLNYLLDKRAHQPTINKNNRGENDGK